MPPPISSSPMSGLGGGALGERLRRLHPARLGVGGKRPRARPRGRSRIPCSRRSPADASNRLVELTHTTPAFQLRRDVEGEVDRLRPDAGGKPVLGVVGERHGLFRRAEGHGDRHRPEDLDPRHGRRRLRRWSSASADRSSRRRAARRGSGRASRPLGDALRHQLADALKLHRRHDRADVDRLVERRTDAQRIQPRASAWRRRPRGRPPAPAAASRRSTPGPD